jgi:hypothetical protein
MSRHIPEGVDARRTPAAEVCRTLRLALTALILGAIAFHVWIIARI